MMCCDGSAGGGAASRVPHRNCLRFWQENQLLTLLASTTTPRQKPAQPPTSGSNHWCVTHPGGRAGRPRPGFAPPHLRRYARVLRPPPAEAGQPRTCRKSKAPFRAPPVHVTRTIRLSHTRSPKGHSRTGSGQPLPPSTSFGGASSPVTKHSGTPPPSPAAASSPPHRGAHLSSTCGGTHPVRLTPLWSRR